MKSLREFADEDRLVAVDDDPAEERAFLSGIELAGYKRAKYDAVQKRKHMYMYIGAFSAATCLIVLTIVLAVVLPRKDTEPTCPSGYNRDNVDFVFFVVGDWGRHNSNSQQTTAQLMATLGDCFQPDFVISAGDNFYGSGLSSAKDPSFSTSFSAAYKHPSLSVPWYAVLGNHDYGDSLPSSMIDSGECVEDSWAECKNSSCCYSPLWQVANYSTWPSSSDSRWHCQHGPAEKRTWVWDDGSVDIVFFDTNPFIKGYQNTDWAELPGGIASANQSALKEALATQLASTNSTWRLVVGHHPIHSYGSHCMTETSDCMDMAFVAPYLRENKVAAYFNGHEHDQQLIQVDGDPVFYVTSGAGSDIRSNEFEDVPEGELAGAKFLSDKNGFVAVTLTSEEMQVYFYTSDQSSPAYSQRIPRVK